MNFETLQKLYLPPPRMLQIHAFLTALTTLITFIDPTMHIRCRCSLTATANDSSLTYLPMLLLLIDLYTT